MPVAYRVTRSGPSACAPMPVARRPAPCRSGATRRAFTPGEVVSATRGTKFYAIYAGQAVVRRQGFEPLTR